MSTTNQPSADAAKLEVILPPGMLGASKHDDAITSLMRSIASRHGDEATWPDKYGATVDNDRFMMHPFCWCEREDCPWCWDESEKGRNAPNFRHKSTGFEVWWYKYIGRSMEFNMPPTKEILIKILEDCL